MMTKQDIALAKVFSKAPNFETSEEMHEHLLHEVCDLCVAECDIDQFVEACRL